MRRWPVLPLCRIYLENLSLMSSDMTRIAYR
jgi:hypothetical protein